MSETLDGLVDLRGTFSGSTAEEVRQLVEAHTDRLVRRARRDARLTPDLGVPSRGVLRARAVLELLRWGSSGGGGGGPETHINLDVEALPMPAEDTDTDTDTDTGTDSADTDTGTADTADTDETDETDSAVSGTAGTDQTGTDDTWPTRPRPTPTPWVPTRAPAVTLVRPVARFRTIPAERRPAKRSPAMVPLPETSPNRPG
ncbi:MAG: hypothetical protein IPH29_11685 [Candidatus Microthrix sp.]|nr:hypothetical protein [Candidatus Microthrix sp.]